ncbi:polysaccharide pyruvyl transferase family protein [Candidatus Dojkabacteria bacterium]|nr:polysaccharide pyruvyl transferase family protein [Candidatus Dojkabacteria bacterium]
MLTPNVVIVGGNLLNKGAQAMAFTVVDQIKAISPKARIYLFSEQDYKVKSSSKFKYKFEIIPWSKNIQLGLLFPILKGEKSTRITEILKTTKAIIDISGYALSSVFFSSHWKNFTHSLRYLSSIIIAQKYNIPYFIFPQSIGPLDYIFPYSLIINPLLKKYLRYPTKIYVRERSGLQALSNFTGQNVILTNDLVLGNGEYSLENIFKVPPPFRRYRIVKDSVGIVPNQKIYNRLKERTFLDLYGSIIQTCLSEGKTVYILRHSVEDLRICNIIKRMFETKDNVSLIGEDLTCIELEQIISMFNFLVASRYHSVIHAFKRGVPVVCIGWADKYNELMMHFSQERYFTDVTDLDQHKIINQVRLMLNSYKTEGKVISERYNSLEYLDLFKEVDL